MNRELGKVFITIAVFICQNVTMAQQRICDQQLRCISPADKVVNGNSLPLRFEMVNTGPDIMFSKDTTFYLLYMLVDGKKRIVYHGASAGRSNDTIHVGEASRYIDNYGIRFSFPERPDPFTVDFCVAISSWKVNSWGDTLRFSYHDPNPDNDTCCKEITVLPQKASSIPDENINRTDFLIYPNPASDLLYVRTGQEYQGDLKLTITDLSGRVLLENRYTKYQTADGILRLDLLILPPGIYNMSLQTYVEVAHKKLIISR